MNNAKPLTDYEIEELRVKHADGALQASPFMQRVVATWDSAASSDIRLRAAMREALDLMKANHMLSAALVLRKALDGVA